eukprot:scaffold3954_cov109-Isochrysis_galbana.AAC.4
MASNRKASCSAPAAPRAANTKRAASGYPPRAAPATSGPPQWQAAGPWEPLRSSISSVRSPGPTSIRAHRPAPQNEHHLQRHRSPSPRLALRHASNTASARLPPLHQQPHEARRSPPRGRGAPDLRCSARCLGRAGARLPGLPRAPPPQQAARSARRTAGRPTARSGRVSGKCASPRLSPAKYGTPARAAAARPWPEIRLPACQPRSHPRRPWVAPSSLAAASPPAPRAAAKCLHLACRGLDWLRPAASAPLALPAASAGGLLALPEDAACAAIAARSAAWTAAMAAASSAASASASAAAAVLLVSSRWMAASETGTGSGSRPHRVDEACASSRRRASLAACSSKMRASGLTGGDKSCAASPIEKGEEAPPLGAPPAPPHAGLGGGGGCAGSGSSAGSRSLKGTYLGLLLLDPPDEPISGGVAGGVGGARLRASPDMMSLSRGAGGLPSGDAAGPPDGAEPLAAPAAPHAASTTEPESEGGLVGVAARFTKCRMGKLGAADAPSDGTGAAGSGNFAAARRLPAAARSTALAFTTARSSSAMSRASEGAELLPQAIHVASPSPTAQPAAASPSATWAMAAIPAVPPTPARPPASAAGRQTLGAVADGAPCSGPTGVYPHPEMDERIASRSASSCEPALATAGAGGPSTPAHWSVSAAELPVASRRSSRGPTEAGGGSSARPWRRRTARAARPPPRGSRTGAAPSMLTPTSPVGTEGWLRAGTPPPGAVDSSALEEAGAPSAEASEFAGGAVGERSGVARSRRTSGCALIISPSSYSSRVRESTFARCSALPRALTGVAAPPAQRRREARRSVARHLLLLVQPGPPARAAPEIGGELRQHGGRKVRPQRLPQQQRHVVAHKGAGGGGQVGGHDGVGGVQKVEHVPRREGVHHLPLAQPLQ